MQTLVYALIIKLMNLLHLHNLLPPADHTIDACNSKDFFLKSFLKNLENLGFRGPDFYSLLWVKLQKWWILQFP